MVEHARFTLRTGRLAVHTGTGGTAGREADREVIDDCALIVIPPRKRGIQYTAALRLYQRGLWNTGPHGLDRAMTVVAVEVHSRVAWLTPQSGIEAGRPEMIPCGSRSGVAANSLRRTGRIWR